MERQSNIPQKAPSYLSAWNKVATGDVVDGEIYFVQGHRECPMFFGFRKDGVWYAQTGAEPYDLTADSEPPTVFQMRVLDSLLVSSSLVPEEYQLVKLTTGEFQIAFQEKKYDFTNTQNWHLDVFGEVVLNVERRIGRISPTVEFWVVNNEEN